MSLHIVPTSFLCAFFEVSANTPSNWRRSGCPNEGHGKWDLKKVFDWWQDNIMVSASEEKNKALAAVKLDYWTDKARNERLKADKEEGLLISKEDVYDQWGARLAEVANGLQALSMRLPPLLEGRSQAAMRKVINEEQRKIRDTYYRTGRFCVPPKRKPAAKKRVVKKKPVKRKTVRKTTRKAPTKTKK